MQVDLLPEWNVHVVEQHAVIRAIDAELGLDGFGGQPDLAADQAAPGTQAVLRYRLGNHIHELAEKISGPPLATIILPILKQLTGELNETSGFYVRVGDTVEALASTTSNQALAYTMKVGERAPLYAVSAGKIALAMMPAADLDEYLRKVTLEPITPRTIISKRRLREDLAASRQSGFAYSHEEFTPGIVGIATAVEHKGRFLGALNLAVPTIRYTPARDIVFRRALSAVASSLGEIIGLRS